MKTLIYVLATVLIAVGLTAIILAIWSNDPRWGSTGAILIIVGLFLVPLAISFSKP